MTKARLILALLFVACFSIATVLVPRQAAWEQAGGRSGSMLALILGDARRMFANEFYAKADGYFHRGNYPSIFDAPGDEDHMAEAAGQDEHGHEHEHGEEEAALPPPRDWIEGFGRHFYPAKHAHLEGGEEREMLPWLRLAVEMDPHQVQTYAVTAYWLRERLGNVDEAQWILRDGLKSNPGDPELLFELALCKEKAADLTRARNIFKAALARWHETERPKKEPHMELLREILGGLVRVELKEGKTNQAIEWLKQLKQASPNPDVIQKRIDALGAPAGL